jgi:hypothetical protein
VRYPERAFENDRDPARPLRVGYLSADFRDHPIARFFFPLLVAHDRACVAVYCYSDVPSPDRQTERLRARADVWRDVSAMDDDAVAEAIRADRIDVLVDLAGHLDNRRLLVFARRPAPVLVTYIGYSDTTGMRSIGYRITDAFHDPLVGGGTAIDETGKPRAQLSGAPDASRDGRPVEWAEDPDPPDLGIDRLFPPRCVPADAPRHRREQPRPLQRDRSRRQRVARIAA